MRIIYLLSLVFFFSCKSTKPLFTEMQTAKIKIDVEVLSDDNMEGRQIGTEGEKKAAQYISQRFEQVGLSKLAGNNGYYQDFTVNQKLYPHALRRPDGPTTIDGINIVGYIDNGSEQTVVIGAHYDHLGYGEFGSLYVGDPVIHNGADDNASGIAGILLLAEKLKNTKSNNNFLFIAFSGEEMGLWGSNYWVKHPNIDLNSINYMINLDMIGRLKADKSIMINGTGTSPIWQANIDQANKYNFKVISSESGYAPTDQTSFYVENIPVLGFFTGQHSDYHKPTDDAHLINYPGIEDITSFVYNVIRNVDDLGKLTFVKTKDEKQEQMSFKVTLGVMPDYLYDGKGMRIDGVREGRTASNADIIKGDIVTKIGDVDVTDMQSYMKALGSFEPGSTVKVIIKRDGKTLEKMVTFLKK